MENFQKKCSRCAGTGFEYHNPDFARNARQQRRMAEIPLRTLAAEMKISVGYLSDLERGRRKPSLKIQNNFEKSLAALRNR
jgi:transcriptional regulator with XRE-family HTH domain